MDRSTPDYRLAPKEPFPAALDDVVASYRWLVEHFSNSPIVVFGDVLEAASPLRCHSSLGDPVKRLPDALHVVSPFVDLSVRETAVNAETKLDPWFNRVMVTQLAACYVQDADLADPLLSPIEADLSGLPPLLVHAARDETLYPSAVALAERAAGAHVRTEFHSVDDTVHSFVLFPFLPGGGAALNAFATFARQAYPSRADAVAVRVADARPGGNTTATEHAAAGGHDK